MRRRGFTFLQFAGTLALVFVAAVIIIPMFAPRRIRDGGGGSCASNSRQIVLAMLQYSGDFDDLLPPKQWAHAIYPFTKNPSLYQCPKDTTVDAVVPPTAEKPFHYSDYWYNRNLAGKAVQSMQSISSTLIIGDGNDGIDRNDGSYGKYRLNFDWRTDTTKPTFRHEGGAIYAFADGHVEWLKPAEVPSLLPAWKPAVSKGR